MTERMTIPNWISLGRIVLSLGLIMVEPLGGIFYFLYVLCGLSDMLDGVIARKTQSASKLGEKLDSLADLIMIGVVIGIFYPRINLSHTVIYWIIVIAIIRFSAMFVALTRYKTFSSLHTFANKATGLILFILPLLYPFVDLYVLAVAACSVASFSAVEELMIQLTSNELDANRKSIFGSNK